MTDPQQPQNQPAPMTPKIMAGAALSLIGGLIMMGNGMLLLTGRGGSNGLAVLGAILLVAGMAVRGQLNKKL